MLERRSCSKCANLSDAAPQGAALHVAFLALNSGVVRALQLGGGSDPANYVQGMRGLNKRQQREQGALVNCNFLCMVRTTRLPEVLHCCCGSRQCNSGRLTILMPKEHRAAMIDRTHC